MKEKDLIWITESERKLLHTPVFDVIKQYERAAGGMTGEYISLEGPDCVVVIPETEGDFVLVRQWRHGASALTTEFPGGVVGRGEDPAEAAYRELLEETGYSAGRLTRLGCVSPNPALFRSRFYVFLAEELENTGRLRPDPDEFIEVLRMPRDETIASYGQCGMSHAFMGTALMMYMREKMQ